MYVLVAIKFVIRCGHYSRAAKIKGMIFNQVNFVHTKINLDIFFNEGATKCWIREKHMSNQIKSHISYNE